MDSRHIEEVLLKDDIDLLLRFRSLNGLALSVYLDLGSGYRKERVLPLINHLIRKQLESLDVSKENQQEIQEDLDLIRLYMNTNGNVGAKGIVIFSCASELLWRAYRLSFPIPPHVHVGAQLDVEPFIALLRNQNAVHAPWQRLAV